METYKMLKQRQKREFDEFPMKYATNQEQFEKGMLELGLKPTDTNKIFTTQSGGFYRKDDAKKLRILLDRHQEELENAIAMDNSGTGFIFQMFYFELKQHEYSYTEDPTDTLRDLGITLDMINRNAALKYGFNLACEKQIYKLA